METPATNLRRAIGRNNLRWAMFGLAITAFFLSYQMLTEAPTALSRSSAFMIVFVILCPPSLLSVAVDPEVGSNAFYVTWALIALANAALYATVRTLVFRRLQRPD
jgi:hypothetical protein